MHIGNKENAQEWIQDWLSLQAQDGRDWTSRRATAESNIRRFTDAIKNLEFARALTPAANTEEILNLCEAIGEIKLARLRLRMR